MADRISSLPDTILCYILSFLPTKVAVATSVLSKRWKPLWLSVPTLHFDDFAEPRKEKHNHFVQSVYAIILLRDMRQPIQTFHLSCASPHCNPINVNVWINAAAQRRVENLDLRLPLSWMIEPPIKSPSSIFFCRTLVVLKLKRLAVEPLSPVDFPSLKTLHLTCVRFSDRRFLAELLSGCPVLEDFEAQYLLFVKPLTEGEFKRLPKLVRADIYKLCIPLEAVNNVECLRIDRMDDGDTNPCFKGILPVFCNLTRIELCYFFHVKDWLVVVEVLKHCPKLQVLVINQNKFPQENKEGGDWPYPQSVPESISSHLKTCRLNNYKGSEGEFLFVRYIMQNARLLQSMSICSHFTTNGREKFKMMKKLSLCTRPSATCKLSFK